MSKKLYRILGIDENEDEVAIRKAYRKLALKYHPDKNPGDPLAEAKFKEIAAAYEILGDSEKRQKYDNGLIDDTGKPKYDAPEREHENEPKAYAKEQNFRSEPTSQTNEADAEETHSFRASQPQSSPYSDMKFFFNPQPTFYYFFNSHDDAERFEQPRQYQFQPTFIFITPSPLEILLEKINAENEKTRQGSAQNQARHVKEQAQQPPHVFIQSNYAPQMERIIDRLISSMIMLEMMERAFNYRHENQPEFF
jgi:curved DNA-binding protein CbpA